MKKIKIPNMLNLIVFPVSIRQQNFFLNRDVNIQKYDNSLGHFNFSAFRYHKTPLQLQFCNINK